MKQDTRKTYEAVIKNRYYGMNRKSCADVKANGLEEAVRIAKVLFRPTYCEAMFVSEKK